MPSREPFPVVSQSRQYVGLADSSSSTNTSRKRRSSSNNLPGEIRGDTGAAALSTLTDQKYDSAGATESARRSATEKALRPHSKRRKAKTAFRRWKSISLRHTWLTPLILIITILSLYAINPTESNPLHSAIFLSYPLRTSADGLVQYGKGGRDFIFVAFYTIVLSFTREFLMQRLIRPMAIHCGIKSRAKQSRFMEQAYTAMYFAIFGPFGLYVMSRTPVWYFNSHGMFDGFPHREHEGLFKAYYLLQAAYWIQQALVLMLMLEKPRKDFKELVGHHIITIALIWCSYRFHFTYMGLAVYITHDISDFFLATSKILNYISSPITGPFFGTFIFVWAYLRHYLNLCLLYAVLTDFRTVGPFELDWETQQYKCWVSQYITFALLACLQSLNIFWFFLVLRVAKRYVINNVVEDVRSEDGEDETGVVESTEEKRKKMAAVMGDEGNGHAVIGGEGNGHAVAGRGAEVARSEPPRVLLNGVPVDEVAAAASTPFGRLSKGGRKVVEVSSQERKMKSR